MGTREVRHRGSGARGPTRPRSWKRSRATRGSASRPRLAQLGRVAGRRCGLERAVRFEADEDLLVPSMTASST
eukprot:16436196-Heterocapsa_arctica.AAC.3